jgi:hypothetical protein
LGTYQGDRFIEDAEHDPDIKLTKGDKAEGSDGEANSPNAATYGQTKLS